MRALLVFFFAISFSASALAQDTSPKVGNKPLVQVKPNAPMGCKLVGTVKGTRLWAGDCTASATAPSEAVPPLPDQAAGAKPGGSKN